MTIRTFQPVSNTYTSSEHGCHYNCSNVSHELTPFFIIIIIITENDINGKLLMLLLDDIEDFSKVIPKSGSRLMIKQAVRSLEKRGEIYDHEVIQYCMDNT